MHAEYTSMDFTIYEIFRSFCVKQNKKANRKKSESNNKTANKSILLNVKLTRWF